MSTAQVTTNKAKFSDTINTGDVALISKTIDEVAKPDVLFHAPARRLERLGRKHSS
jgi:hypothetical protein